MNIWEILGIEQTKDAREIKRAYARQLRLHNPEDDPRGFMQLRDAYEGAIAQAQAGTSPIPPVVSLIQEGSDAVDAVPRTELFDKLEALYNDFRRRMDIDEWRRFLDSLSISELQALQGDIVPFLNEHYVLPTYIFIYLDAEMDFFINPSFRWMILMKAYNDICTPLLNRMLLKPELDFDLEQFAKLCIDANIAKLRAETDAALALARQAIQIYDGDYFIYYILGDCLLMQKNLPNYDEIKREAAEAFERSVCLQPSNNVHNRLAHLWEELGEYEKALEHCWQLRESDMMTMYMREFHFECEIKHAYGMGWLPKRKYKRLMRKLHPKSRLKEPSKQTAVIILCAVIILILFYFAYRAGRSASTYEQSNLFLLCTKSKPLRV